VIAPVCGGLDAIAWASVVSSRAIASCEIVWVRSLGQVLLGLGRPLVHCKM
jgi:hypothetical protein